MEDTEEVTSGERERDKERVEVSMREQEDEQDRKIEKSVA